MGAFGDYFCCVFLAVGTCIFNFVCGVVVVACVHACVYDIIVCVCSVEKLASSTFNQHCHVHLAQPHICNLPIKTTTYICPN